MSKKRLPCLILIFSMILSISPVQNNRANADTHRMSEIETVVIDAQQDNGNFDRNASGFLWSFGEGGATALPPDEFVTPLSVKLHRTSAGYTVSQYPRLSQLGITQVAVLSDVWRGEYPDEVLPGSDGDWSKWEEKVAEIVTRDKNVGIVPIYDIYNEPDNDNAYGTTRLDLYKEGWKRAFDIIRAISPSAKIEGPEFCYALPGDPLFDQFLLFAKENNCLPDIISWHFPYDYELEVEYLRKFCAENGIPNPEICISEYVREFDQNAGMLGWNMAQIERTGVTGMHGIWTANHDTLCDTVVKRKDQYYRTSQWWVYQRYASMSGKILKSQHSQSIELIPVLNDGGQELKILLANNGGLKNKNIQIKIQNATALGLGDSVLVEAERLPHSDGGIVEKIDLSYVGQYDVNNDTLDIVMPWEGDKDAYFVSIKPYNNQGVAIENRNLSAYLGDIVPVLVSPIAVGNTLKLGLPGGFSSSYSDGVFNVQVPYGINAGSYTIEAILLNGANVEIGREKLLINVYEKPVSARVPDEISLYGNFAHLSFEGGGFSYWSQIPGAVSVLNDSEQAYVGDKTLEFVGNDYVSVWGGEGGKEPTPQIGDLVGGYFYIKLLEDAKRCAPPSVRIVKGSDAKVNYCDTEDIDMTQLPVGEWVRINLKSTGIAVRDTKATQFRIENLSGNHILLDNIQFGKIVSGKGIDNKSYIYDCFNGDFEDKENLFGWGQYVPNYTGSTFMNEVEQGMLGIPKIKNGRKMIEIFRGGNAWNIYTIGTADANKSPAKGNIVYGSYWLYVDKDADLTKTPPWVNVLYSVDGNPEHDVVIATSSNFPVNDLRKGAWNEIPVLPVYPYSIGENAQNIILMIMSPVANLNPDFSTKFYMDDIKLKKAVGDIDISNSYITHGSDGKAKVNVIIQNSLSEASVFKELVVGLYSKNNPSDTQYKTCSIPAKGSAGVSIAQYPINFDVRYKENDQIVTKVMLWEDFISIKPVTDSKILVLE